LQKKVEKLTKKEEILNFNNSKIEDFYDIVIDINSIKNVNKEGWKVKFNEKGLEKYQEHGYNPEDKVEKGQKSITIGVVGNNNKGKSFLLSKISKIQLLTGTSIQTKGLSVKYPELENYKGRQLILLDSAGLETPVLKKINIESQKNEKENENQIDEFQEKNEDELNENQIDKKNEQNEIKSKNNQKTKEMEKNEEFKENSRDKIMTELFLQNFIIKESDILLLVVGKLTYSEQLLINKIKEESKRQNKGRILIIHNLQEFRTKEQVEDYIHNYLFNYSTFNLIKRTRITTEKDKENNNKEKKEKQNLVDDKENKLNNQININNEENNFHLFNNENNENEEIPFNQNQNEEIKINPDDEIKNEKNIIGKKEEKVQGDNNKINENDFDDLKTQINNIHFTEILNYSDKKQLIIYHLILANEDSEAGKYYNPYAYSFIENLYDLVPVSKKFDVFERIKENFKRLSSTILKEKIEDASFNENENIIKDKIIKLKYEKDLSLKKCYIDELGFSFFKTGNFEPKYNYFKPDENTLEIRLEIPGITICKVHHNIIGDETIIAVKGEKKKDSKPKELEDNLFNIREFSEFELNIPLKAEDFKISQEKPKKLIFANGICIIQYELAHKGKETEVSADQSEDL